MLDKDAKPQNINFDFLYVVPGVAIGLAIVRVCQFLGHVLVYKNADEWLRLPAGWAIIWSLALLAYSAQYWFFTAKRRERQDYSQNFGTYLFIIIMPVLISFISFILCPNIDERGFANLGAHFESQSRLLYLFIGLSFWAAALESWVIGEEETHLSYPMENWARIIVGAIFAIFWFAPRNVQFSLLNYVSFDLDREWVVVTIAALLGIFRLAMNRWPI